MITEQWREGLPRIDSSSAKTWADTWIDRMEYILENTPSEWNASIVSEFYMDLPWVQLRPEVESFVEENPKWQSVLRRLERRYPETCWDIGDEEELECVARDIFGRRLKTWNGAQLTDILSEIQRQVESLSVSVAEAYELYAPSECYDLIYQSGMKSIRGILDKYGIDVDELIEIIEDRTTDREVYFSWGILLVIKEGRER